jgi:hypothetical protein
MPLRIHDVADVEFSRHLDPLWRGAMGNLTWATVAGRRPDRRVGERSSRRDARLRLRGVRL